MQYVALNHLMYEFGFTQRGPETLRSCTILNNLCTSPWWDKHMVDDRIKAELQPDVVVDAYEMKSIVH
jgi:hypothetical protein